MWPSPEEWIAVASIILACTAFFQLWVSYAQMNLCNVSAYTEAVSDRAQFKVVVQNHGPGIAYEVLVRLHSDNEYISSDGYEVPGIVGSDGGVHVDSVIEMEVLPPGMSTGTAAAFEGPGKIPGLVVLGVQWKERRLISHVTRQYNVPQNVPANVEVSMPYPT